MKSTFFLMKRKLTILDDLDIAVSQPDISDLDHKSAGQKTKSDGILKVVRQNCDRSQKKVFDFSQLKHEESHTH